MLMPSPRPRRGAWRFSEEGGWLERRSTARPVGSTGSTLPSSETPGGTMRHRCRCRRRAGTPQLPPAA
jgi:hypothetical protein